jgi:hypothetical protein
MADYSPVYAAGNLPFTMTAASAITGGQVLVAVAAGTVGPAGGASAVAIGVAAHDVASGQRVSVWPLANSVHEIVTTGTVTALDGVTSSTAGTVATVVPATGAAAGTLLGIALTTATTGLKVRFVGRG